MDRKTSTTETMSVSEVEGRFGDLVNGLDQQGRRIVVEKSGAAVAAIVPISDLRRLIRMDDQMREAREVVAEMRAAFADVPDEEIERETERILTDIREEDRAARRRDVKTA